GTVAVLLPAIVGLAASAKISPSKLLIPLSFGALLGGAMTLIGTPPNIIVSNTLREANTTAGQELYRPFEFFDFTPVGVLILIAGIGFMITFGRRLLPNYGIGTEDIEPYDPMELVSTYDLTENMGYLRILPGSQLIGKSIADTHLRRNYGVTVVEIIRDSEMRPVAQFGRQRVYLETNRPAHIFPTAETTLGAEDIIVLQGNREAIRNVAYAHNLSFEPMPEDSVEALINRQVGIAEVLLPPRSSLIGKTLRQSRFGPTYSLSVLGIKRPGDEKPDMNTATLHFGDSLLVQGLWHDIMALQKNKEDFVVLGRPEAMVDETNTRRAPIAAAILAGMLGILILDLLPLATTALIAALAMVLTGCLTMDEAYDAIDWKSIVLIAGMLPMATALTQVGLVDQVARQVQNSLGDADPRVVLSVLFLLTAMFTQVLSNTATAVLVAPIAIETATRLDVTPYAFLMGVAVAASMAFASPVASPVNMLVLGAGKYRFVDYIKVGVPMLLIAFVIAVIFLPIIFPF
ncbi:MAG: SLC13 family permease, partial [Chloroflexota bacterium]